MLRKVGSKHESGGESVAPSDLVRPEEQTTSRGRQRLGPVQSRDVCYCRAIRRAEEGEGEVARAV